MTDSSNVRLLIPDLTVDGDTSAELTQIFTDDQILAFLEIGGENVRRAAAYAKQTLAGTQALLLKYVKDHDLTIDGPKVAAELLAEAQWLFDAADAADRRDNEDIGFDIVSVPYHVREDSWDFSILW